MSDDRRLSFGAIAAKYHRFRAPLSAAAVDWLVPAGCAAAAELGAGTGLFTRQLAERVPRVHAVEPDERMRGELAAACPDVTVLDGSAERVPLPDASVDAVFAVGAWHWFEPVRAVPEIARVLRRGGVLAVAWNIRAAAVPWVAELDRLVRRRFPSDRRPGRFVLPGDAPFGEPEREVIPWSYPMTPGELVESLSTYSHVIMLPQKQRDAVLDAVREHLATHPDLAGRGTIDVPFESVCYRTRTAAA